MTDGARVEGRPVDGGHTRRTLWVSAVYVLSFAVTAAVLDPLQAMAVPSLDGAASLVFLPHGVRVLAAWLWGWRAIPALLPGALATHLWLQGIGGIVTADILALIAGVVAAPAVFEALKAAGLDLTMPARRRLAWRDVLAVGLGASFCNSLVTNLVYDAPIQAYAAYVVGDFFGLFVLMGVLMVLLPRRHRG